MPAATILTNDYGRELHPRLLEEAFAKARTRVPGLVPGFRFHDCRQYFSSLLIAGSADVKVVEARACLGQDHTRHLSAIYGPDSDDSTRAVVGAVMADRSGCLRTPEGRG